MAFKYQFPVGFIVEGRGEYNSFNALFYGITGVSARTPCSRPQGYGRILKSLEAELTDLVVTHSVARVVVCIDLKDVVSNKNHGFEDCAALRLSLQERADEWLKKIKDDPRVRFPPEEVVVIIQVKKFESWMIADLDALNQAGLLERTIKQVKNVDEMSKDPGSVIKGVLKKGLTTKNPNTARDICRAIRPDIAKKNSRSFRKFDKEMRLAAEKWLNHCLC